MRYDDPELRARLAGEYVLGQMPPRARRRFERLMAVDPTLARLVGDWADRLLPLDAATPPEQPPARLWRAIESSLAGGAATASAAPSPPSWFSSVFFWRGLALAAGSAAAALALYIGVFAGRAPAPSVVAVLSAPSGAPGWVAIPGRKPGEVRFSAVAPAFEPKPHAFELWGIEGGQARPLILLPPQPGGVATLKTTQLPAPGGLLAVSLEPPGGSPTGHATGPVLYQGKVIIRAP